jgi:uncharacterized membrane protein
MKTPARIFGHPIHPILIAFPIALWSFSFIADCIYYFGNHIALWESIAFYTLAGGIIGAVLAALPGAVDYFSIPSSKASRIATWHAVVNVSALVVFCISFYLRTSAGRRLVGGSFNIPILLSLVGVLLMGVAGWLGGELVYKHQIGVQQESRDVIPDEHYPRRAA